MLEGASQVALVRFGRGEKIIFPIKMESGIYLELQSNRNCKLYGSKGELLKDVTIVGEIPTLKTGTNEFTFICDGPENLNARVQFTVTSEGEPYLIRLDPKVLLNYMNSIYSFNIKTKNVNHVVFKQG